MQEFTPLISLGPLNKPKIIGNYGELSDLEYLPTKTEKSKISPECGRAQLIDTELSEIHY